MSSQPYFPNLHLRTLLRLRDVEEILKQERIFRTIPSRPTLIKLCDSGTLESTRINNIIYIYEDSLLEWLVRLQTATAA